MIGAVLTAFLLSYSWTLIWQKPLCGIAYKFDGGKDRKGITA